MPATTNPTPAEIASLERRIAEGVMGWHERDCSWWSKGSLDHSIHEHYMDEWSPWNDPADDLEVLERLWELVGKETRMGIVLSKSWFPEGWEWGVTMGGYQDYSPGDHYGPAVCELARKVMERR